jgi:ankyrin repeat protein
MVMELCDERVRDEPDDDGNTPLHLAAACGNTEAVRMLLHLGMAAMVSAGIGGQWTFLTCIGHLAFVRLGFDIQILRDGAKGATRQILKACFR